MVLPCGKWVNGYHFVSKNGENNGKNEGEKWVSTCAFAHGDDKNTPWYDDFLYVEIDIHECDIYETYKKS
jgi:hypothetical protein